VNLPPIVFLDLDLFCYVDIGNNDLRYLLSLRLINSNELDRIGSCLE
jgi:hypothetical protein